MNVIIRYKRLLLIGGFLACVFQQIFAQGVQIQGVVTDNETGEPIPQAHVFVVNSQAGTLTNEKGSFSLRDIPLGAGQLVVSHISYQQVVLDFSYQTSSEYTRNLRLRPGNYQLEAVTVIAKKKGKHKRALNRFTRALLGNSPNAAQCQLLNPEVLTFETSSAGNLSVKARELLEIENHALGYKLFLLLSHFQIQGQEISYEGKPFFEPLEVQSQKQRDQWLERREETYLGSPRHFFQSLVQGNSAQAGFQLFSAQLNAQKGEFISGNPVTPNSIIQTGRHAGERLLNLPEFLRVVYTQKITQRANRNDLSRITSNLSRPGEEEIVAQAVDGTELKDTYPISYLFGRKRNIFIDTLGYAIEPEAMTEYGYWAGLGVADWLPREYRLTIQIPLDAPSPNTTATPQKNGFLLSGLRIPLEAIQSGGPPKDGIPAINQPKFMTINRGNEYLNASDEVLGVHHEGVAKAYPIKILNFHEIVNDRIGNTPIAVTYCPLCGSGITFRSEVEDTLRTFGVSGLLYNSDVLLYDDQTQSLWSQILGEAISGPSAGQKLPTIATERTTWGDWQQRFPHTTVMSHFTGYSRDYSENPYEGYEDSPALMFEVRNRSNQLPKKAWIIGIEMKGKYKAYPFSQLKKAKGAPIKEVFQGHELRIIFDSQHRAARILDVQGNLLPATPMYWFAWKAFHPKTDIFNFNKGYK